MKFLRFSILLMLSAIITLPVLAQEQPATKLVVRAIARDAKFIGSSMGGALIVVREAETGTMLARGFTAGSTGDTGRLMRTDRTRQMQLSTPGAALFETSLAIEEPTFVTIEATAPHAQRQSHATVSTQLWMIPGKDITGDGIILEIPGFSVDLLQPQAHETAGGTPISITANVVMMCGCPTEPGGLWDSSEYEIAAWVKKGGKTVAEVPMSFAGKESTYEGSFTPEENGSYEITVYAYHAKTGNTGVDRTTVTVQGR
ncbi:MAG: hypothetical protein R3211_09270 [Balneolaceae bacterium]|nr:hypothetical protein [Balneolaceae bacterium]